MSGKTLLEKHNFRTKCHSCGYYLWPKCLKKNEDRSEYEYACGDYK